MANLVKDSKLRSGVGFYLSRQRKFAITVSGLAKVAIFTTNVDAENQTLINHKCVCGALNRHFCQTRVSSSSYSGGLSISVAFSLFFLSSSLNFCNSSNSRNLIFLSFSLIFGPYCQPRKNIINSIRIVIIERSIPE